MTAIVKWIRCEVTDRSAFDLAQRRWTGLAGLDGFEWQVGGWELVADGADIAHVVARWRDETAHRRFVAGAHDAIAGDQAATYHAIEVLLGSVEHGGWRPDPTTTTSGGVVEIVRLAAGDALVDSIDPEGALVVRLPGDELVAMADRAAMRTWAQRRERCSIGVEPGWTVVADR